MSQSARLLYKTSFGPEIFPVTALAAANIWTCQIYFTCYIAHTSYKVTVCGRNASFMRSQNTHVSAETWSTGRCADNSSCLNEGLNKSFLDCLKIELPVLPELRCSEGLSLPFCPLKSLLPHADLRYGHLYMNRLQPDQLRYRYLIDSVSVLWQMWEGYCWL